ncbi:aldo/keto reductase [Nocardiopsis xinjiangensis]|uniref:aldo/keto reductase n=1 Tax=Nocardiopsis xinjiangensis TaxID=124285 RepID=UPI00034950C4|nr:aldo/keto reductase [Nocardiopsis xinjiangensis]
MTQDVPRYELVDGTELPALGFGTYRLTGEEGTRSILSAVEAGYRLLDSAVNYQNEEAVGEAVRRAPVPREELWVTSKLPGRDHAHARALQAIEGSLRASGLEYLDLYLIHWPNPIEDLYVQAWRALVEARDRGLVRSIGVSNFLPEHLDRIVEDTGVVPSVNQVEMHPYFPQEEQRSKDTDLGIRTESWSPLGRANALLGEPVIEDIARAHGRTAAQIILRWHHQLGAVPIPKASGPERQHQNLSVFDFSLSDEEVGAITALGRADGRNKGQDPAVHQEF